ncbi:MFS transporter [Actinoplanes aureus]|uniref:MFS transporter n=1 Tax=Actinoplanes aureus TaxID=2792083 RepID=A0A931CNM0_9ACTN|nr:MFS transporter [Actinoplanes aureus]MBG0568195.1 MFS transporter [Actinoplanes aureus]
MTITSPIERALTWSTVTGSTAKGVLFGVSALYFTTVVGLSPGTVGAGLTLAGVTGIAAAFGAGHLCDRFGAHRVLIMAIAGHGAALAVYCFARTLIAFLIVACLAAGTQAAQRTAQATLLARHFTGPGRLETRARLRVATNVFVGAGSALAAGALAVGTATAYTTAMLVAAVLVLSSTVPLRALRGLRHDDEPVAAQAAGRPPLRDRRYVAVAGLNAVITMQFGLLTVGMPLWVTAHTNAPAPTVALLLVLNTILVTLFQVRAARLVRDVPTAGRVVFRAALLLVLACLLYAAAAQGGAAIAVGVLVLAVLAHTAGEVLSEAGGWELAFELADPRNVGAYQGVSQTGFAIGTALAPAVVTSTVISHGTSGWLLLGVVFLSAGTGTYAVASRSPVSSQHR